MSRLAVVVALLLLVACSRPDSVSTHKSPVDGLYYTVEEYRASGPTSDTNRVIAHLDRNGHSTRMPVLEGENLVITAIRWESPTEVTVCLNGGITETFRNEITLISGAESVTIHNRLSEFCEHARP